MRSRDDSTGKVVEAADANVSGVGLCNDWALDGRMLQWIGPLAGADPRRFHFKQGVEGGGTSVWR